MKSGRLKKTSLLEKYRIGCSDGVKTEIALAGLFEIARRSSAGLRAIGVRPHGIPAAPPLRLLGSSAGLRPFGSRTRHVGKAGNEMAVKFLKTNDHAKSLIPHS
jgi:hypothetical protein